MFSHISRKFLTSITLSIACLCLVIYLSFIPYIISVVRRDWDSKVSTLTTQVSTYLSLRLSSIETSAQVLVNQYKDAILEEQLSQFEGNRIMLSLHNSNTNILDAAVMTEHYVYLSSTKAGVTAIYDNFGQDAYQALQQFTAPTYLISKVARSANNAYLLRVIPITQEDKKAYLIIYFDPYSLIASMSLKENPFFQDAEIILALDSHELYQLLERKNTPVVNWERRIPDSESYKIENCLELPLDIPGFVLYFNISDDALTHQYIRAALPPLLILILLLTLSFAFTWWYSRSIKRRLEQLVYTMDEYRSQKEDDIGYAKGTDS